MRIRPFFILFLLCFLTISMSGVAHGNSPAPPSSGANETGPGIDELFASEPLGSVVVYFFYNQHCTECQKAIVFLEGFKERHPEVIIRSFDLAANTSNQQLFQQFNQRYNVPFSPVPSIFVGPVELVNYETIEMYLDDVVNQSVQHPEMTHPVPTTPGISSSPEQEPPKLTIPLVIVAGLIDGINPCAFSVLIFLLVSLMALNDKKRMLKVGVVYIAAVFLFYFFSGLGLFAVVQISGISRIFAMIAATVAFVAGAIMIKDALSGGSGSWLVIPESRKGTITRYVKDASIPAAFVLGILVGMFELPCTGGIYLAIISLISQEMTMMAGIPLLLLYNILFIVPLVLILGIIYFGLPPERLEAWRTENRVLVRLGMGIMMILIGVAVVVTLLIK